MRLSGSDTIHVRYSRRRHSGRKEQSVISYGRLRASFRLRYSSAGARELLTRLDAGPRCSTSFAAGARLKREAWGASALKELALIIFERELTTRSIAICLR
jgi:hypothetical protein